MWHYLKRFKASFNKIDQVHNYLINDLKSPKLLMGQIMARLNKEKKSVDEISEMEFQVFSQWGDDGIIQYLINNIDIENKTFVEFGVENYRESNTRFLLINNKWHGLVIDGSEKNISFIKNDPIFWATHLFAKQAFIVKENINQLIQYEFLDKGYDKKIGILSVDIDGNDYWIWETINVVDPTIVIVEYNATYGDTNKWTIPYIGDFVRNNYDNTRQYWGASLNAFCHLAEQKGYDFVGCNSNGNNAYFIKKEKNRLRKLTAQEGYKRAFFREYKNKDNEYVSAKDAPALLKGKKIFDLDKNQIIEIE
jgi:hypothetical protein